MSVQPSLADRLQNAKQVSNRLDEIEEKLDALQTVVDELTTAVEDFVVNSNPVKLSARVNELEAKLSKSTSIAGSEQSIAVHSTGQSLTEITNPKIFMRTKK